MPPPLIRELNRTHTEALRALLAKDVSHNLYLLGVLEEFGIVPTEGRAEFTFYGSFAGSTLTAAVFVGGNGGLVIPSANDSSAIGDIAQGLAKKTMRLRSSIGDLPAVDLLVRALCSSKPKVSRPQRMYSVSADDLGPFTNPTLRLATEADLPQLLPMAAMSVMERLDRDPLAEDPTGFEDRVRLRVRERRTYVLSENSQLVFKVDLGSRSQYGAELEGLFTLPNERRRGHATLSLGQISRHLLSSLPRLSIRVDDRDPSLAGVARKVGYIAGRAQKLVVAS